MLLFKLTFAKIISFLTLKDFYIDCCNSSPVLVKSKGLQLQLCRCDIQYI